MIKDQYCPVLVSGVKREPAGYEVRVLEEGLGVKGRCNRDLDWLMGLCDGQHTVAGIVAEVDRRYGSHPENRRKVVDTLEFLKLLGLVELFDSGERVDPARLRRSVHKGG
ncbi:MAG: hypothetical protein K6T75_08540 [Acetobacteraceae bacterium]|nr:hypothetical protein [Acetobacteraceae bacterium]